MVLMAACFALAHTERCKLLKVTLPVIFFSIDETSSESFLGNNATVLLISNRGSPTTVLLGSKQSARALNTILKRSLKDSQLFE